MSSSSNCNSLKIASYPYCAALPICLAQFSADWNDRKFLSAGDMIQMGMELSGRYLANFLLSSSSKTVTSLETISGYLLHVVSVVTNWYYSRSPCEDVDVVPHLEEEVLAFGV